MDSTVADTANARGNTQSTSSSRRPAEVYLREFRDTPAGDLDALVELCSLGMIRTTNMAAAYRDLPIYTGEQWAHTLADVSTLFPEGARWDGDEAERHKVWTNLSGIPVHAGEVALRVRAVQRATDHLIAYHNEDPVQQAWRDCDDEGEAWQRLADITGAALAEFHVRVEVHLEEPDLPEEWRLPIWWHLHNALLRRDAPARQ
jgi:hypothetical protein